MKIYKKKYVIFQNDLEMNSPLKANNRINHIKGGRDGMGENGEYN